MDSEKLDKLLNEFNQQIVNKEYKKVVDSCRELLKKNPKEADLYYYMARAEHGLKDIKSAIKDFTSALRYNREYQKAYCNRGLLFIKEGNIILQSDKESIVNGQGKTVDRYFREVFAC